MIAHSSIIYFMISYFLLQCRPTHSSCCAINVYNFQLLFPLISFGAM